MLVIDLVLLASLIAVMILANRLWAIAMVSLHGLGVVAHWVRAQEAGMIPPTIENSTQSRKDAVSGSRPRKMPMADSPITRHAATIRRLGLE